MAGTLSNANFLDIPDVVLNTIFSLVVDTRTRNAMSLVCLKWHLLERSTRKSLALRGNVRDLFLLPTCFRAVTDLDLSLLSPWGHPLLNSSPNPLLLAQLLRRAFPSVVSLVVYIRNPSTLHLLAPQWPDLRHIKLIRWHQRLPTLPLGTEFVALFEHCQMLSTLDISHFHCWTEDLPPAIEAYPILAASLSRLNILKHSSAEGFKSHELLAITASCPNLRELLATCIFDHRFVGFVSDQTLLALASNCPSLSLLHLVDATSLSNVRPDSNDDGFTSEDASISHAILGDVFAGLPLLEVLVLDVCHNVRDAWPALELLTSRCPSLKSLKLGQFHGICSGIDSRPDGIALCHGLESLSIKNSADLTDNSLEAISIGCPRLSKFEVLGCKKITAKGIWKLIHVLRNTLVDVKISSCKNLNAFSSLQAMEPIRDRIERLHIDCVWGSVKNLEIQTASSSEETMLKKKSKSHDVGNDNSLCSSTWSKLNHLSLWIAVGELLTPLSMAGLDDCPSLEEIEIKIEGDCSDERRPCMGSLGLRFLACYPSLSRMLLDCSGVIGYALTAPPGYPDLSLWERFFFNGIEILNLNELNYWPAQDMDVNQRSLFLPAAALLAQCGSLRKLFFHGTANEHLMMFLLRIPTLRDVQLRQDYYPAPENDMSTEIRVESCRRFENALNSINRHIPD
ncbi:F-box/LRR-repeat MAX2-like protein A [Hibiscus syriacus]|uniref:F-box/LRR-repeat MAX2-like protein A n=1 Tax=Hibiscus syriacus TaxID=106335 RepID=A0A6A3BHS7_HIBSY|nr:F-box/LRR-repeat MAX2 homolog A-like [Hibiscus syriacus]KAE8714998.1 F-box/LRR-repeat MAX2-like protein A [Hibiscus syriacus]